MDTVDKPVGNNLQTRFFSLPAETFDGNISLPDFPIDDEDNPVFFTPQTDTTLNEEYDRTLSFQKYDIGHDFNNEGTYTNPGFKGTNSARIGMKFETGTNAHNSRFKNEIQNPSEQLEPNVEIPTLDKTHRKSSKDIDEWITILLQCQSLNEDEIEHLCQLLKENLSKEENCVNIFSPLTVVGDIHGQLHDLLELFRIRGLPPDTNYLFLGDYVDRGLYSCETFCLVASLRLRFPSKVSILRGNHESRQTTKIYGFYDECIRKYGNAKTWTILTDTFDYLPISATIDNKIFCDHGGISNETLDLNDVRNLDRVQEIPQCGCMCDLLWSDPSTPDDDLLTDGWRPSPRGAGVIFSEEITEKFLHINNLQFICRAHQVADYGYVSQHSDKVITVFSAPNYCYRCGNLASVMCVDEFMNTDFVSYNSAPFRAIPEKMRFTPDYFV